MIKALCDDLYKFLWIFIFLVVKKIKLGEKSKKENTKILSWHHKLCRHHNFLIFFFALRYCILFLAVKSLDFYYFLLPLIEEKSLYNVKEKNHTFLFFLFFFIIQSCFMVQLMFFLSKQQRKLFVLRCVL